MFIQVFDLLLSSNRIFSEALGFSKIIGAGSLLTNSSGTHHLVRIFYETATKPNPDIASWVFEHY